MPLFFCLYVDSNGVHLIIYIAPLVYVLVLVTNCICNEDPETIEKEELKNGYYLLNIKDNKGVRNKHKNVKPSIPTQLTKLRNEYRK